MEFLPTILGACIIVELGLLVWLLVALKKEVISLRRDHMEAHQTVWSGMVAQIAEIQNATPAIGNALGAILQQFLTLRGELESSRSENGQRATELDQRTQTVAGQLQMSLADIARILTEDVSAGLTSAAEKSAVVGTKLCVGVEAKLDAIRSEVEKLRQEIRETVTFT